MLRHNGRPSISQISNPQAVQTSDLSITHVGKRENSTTTTSGKFFRDHFDQGHALEKRHEWTYRDPHTDATRSGFHARNTLGFDHPHDAASERRGTKVVISSKTGNPEGIGFADQVGGQSAAGMAFEPTQNEDGVHDLKDVATENNQPAQAK